MTTLGLVTMIGVCGFVWGGFALLLTRALRSERRSSGRDSAGRP